MRELDTAWQSAMLDVQCGVGAVAGVGSCKRKLVCQRNSYKIRHKFAQDTNNCQCNSAHNEPRECTEIQWFHVQINIIQKCARVEFDIVDSRPGAITSCRHWNECWSFGEIGRAEMHGWEI